MSFHLVGVVDATSNPAPNSLSQKDPFNGVPTPNGQVSPLWTTQAVKAFFPKSKRNSDYKQDRDLVEFTVDASDGSATYTINIWYFDRSAGKWFQPKEEPSKSFTGDTQYEFTLKSAVPVYLQFSDASAGTLTLRVNSDLVWIL